MLTIDHFITYHIAQAYSTLVIFVFHLLGGSRELSLAGTLSDDRYHTEFGSWYINLFYVLFYFFLITERVIKKKILLK